MNLEFKLLCHFDEKVKEFCGRENPDAQIDAGEVWRAASPNQYPWHAHIRFYKKATQAVQMFTKVMTYCSGALVSTKHIIASRFINLIK